MQQWGLLSLVIVLVKNHLSQCHGLQGAQHTVGILMCEALHIKQGNFLLGWMP